MVSGPGSAGVRNPVLRIFWIFSMMVARTMHLEPASLKKEDTVEEYLSSEKLLDMDGSF